MKRPDCSQILETLNLGVFAFDEEGLIVYWNRWIENASGLAPESTIGKNIFELFPELETAPFRRNMKSVFSFGNFAFFSQKVHRHLISLPSAPGGPAGFDLMEQHCVMGPIWEEGEVAYAYIVVEDVTEIVARERLLSELAMKDPLTSAYNRRYFDRRLTEELDRCRRYNHQMTLVMLDIDHFKGVNDSHGHQFGDETLCAAVRRWTACLRVSDIVARYGGEEFCVLLCETDPVEGLSLAERLRSVVAATEIETGGCSARVTVSAGVAFSRADDRPDDILRRADEALYKAKAEGRNRVEASA